MPHERKRFKRGQIVVAKTDYGCGERKRISRGNTYVVNKTWRVAEGWVYIQIIDDNENVYDITQSLFKS